MAKQKDKDRKQERRKERKKEGRKDRKDKKKRQTLNTNAVLLFLMLVSKISHFLCLFLSSLQGRHFLFGGLHFLPVVPADTNERW